MNKSLRTEHSLLRVLALGLRAVTFHGRVARPVFWTFILILVVFGLGWEFVSFAAGAIIGGRSGSLVADMRWAYPAVMLIPSLSMQARRLHDTGRSAWWLLCCLIPVVGFLLLFVFYLEAGTLGPNAHGPDPAVAPE